jgi:hypothetical protein
MNSRKNAQKAQKKIEEFLTADKHGCKLIRK